MFQRLITFFSILWRFSRPHTIIGTLLSITSLYVLALPDLSGFTGYYSIWLLTLFACLCCNIYITGLNQVTDVEIDRLNKPHLPLASGEISLKSGITICLVALGLALGSAAFAGSGFFLFILLIAGIGTAYSVPPLRLKKHHFGAAAAIAVVRGVLVNAGIFLHYRFQIFGSADFPDYMVALTAFITSFSIGIAWFKDIPDTGGDAEHGVKTLPLVLSRKKALFFGVILVTAAYLYLAADLFIAGLYGGALFHLLMWLIFLVPALQLQTKSNQDVYRFYMLFWVLFFLEYIAYPLIIQLRL